MYLTVHINKNVAVFNGLCSFKFEAHNSPEASFWCCVMILKLLLSMFVCFQKCFTLAEAVKVLLKYLR